ncbi:MAG: hypothetical protein EBV25_03500 [Methylophilaceae bacterium]|nr:hypothetical protein [Methylophilaceae bacterium]
MIGRFAPSPTGPLHFGSLLAALASYLEAKTQDGLWLVRMEDLDKPREVAGAANHILNTLEKFGLEWDGQVVYQSQRSELYQEALNQIKAKSLIYQCSCSRKEIADSSSNCPKPLRHHIFNDLPIMTEFKVSVSFRRISFGLFSIALLLFSN